MILYDELTPEFQKRIQILAIAFGLTIAALLNLVNIAIDKGQTTQSAFLTWLRKIIMRTNQEAVAAIIEIDAGADLSPFIATANTLVTECCGDVTTYDDDRLELIERWLSAHFYTVLNPRVTSEKIGSIAVNYQSVVDLGFDSSHYGQVAMRLDTEGGLARLNDKIKKGRSGTVVVSWLGKNKTDDLAEGN